MELIHVHQIPFEALSEERIDVLLLACSGTQNTNSVLPSFLLPARRKIIMVFCDEEINTANFPQDAEVVRFNTGADINEIHDTLETLCHLYQGDNVKLMIDYTYMNKKILGAIVSFLAINEFTCNCLTVYFYCAEAPAANNTLPPTEPVLQPILLYENYKFNQRPIALIIELNDTALFKNVNELYYTFCPAQAFFYVPVQMLKKDSRAELEHFRASKLVEYLPNDLESLDENLRQLCRQLRLEHRVVIVSIGSKIFSMVAFLINARYPDVEVWQYGATFGESSAISNNSRLVYRAILSDDFPDKIC